MAPEYIPTQAWRRNDEYYNQIKAIASWCNNAPLLESLLEVGHSDVHYQGANIPIKDISACVDKTFDTGMEIDNILPSPEITDSQAKRVASEVVPSSHFMSKEVMLGTLSATILGASHDINKWLNGPFMDKTRFMLRLRVDMESFIGTGIHVDGNERATTAATLVLTRTPSYVDGIKIPFSVKTMYPDITESHEIGTLVHTGRNFGPELLRSINTGNIATQMYWQLKEKGEHVTMTHGVPPSASMSASCNGIDYITMYNDRSFTCGFMMVYDTQEQRYMSLNHSNLSREEIRILRNDEAARIGNSLDKAHLNSKLAITTTDTLFPEIEADVIRENGNSLSAEEFSLEGERF